MNNYIQKGDVLNFVADYDYSSNDVVKVGDIVGIAATDAATGELMAVNTVGVFSIEKDDDGDVFAQGDTVYLTTAKKATLNQTETVLGVAWEASGASVANVNVRLSYPENGADFAAHALVFMQGNATATGTLVQNTFVKAPGTTTDAIGLLFDNSTNNRLKYTGTKTSKFEIEAIFSATGTTTNVVKAKIAKGGEVSDRSLQSIALVSGAISNVVCKDIVELETDEYVELWIANGTGTAAITVTDLYFSAKKIS